MNYEDISFDITSQGFCVTGDLSQSARSISELALQGDINSYIANFINGLVHQGHQQTNSDRPVGGTTAVRIAHELVSLFKILGRDVSGFDMLSINELLKLNAYQRDSSLERSA